MTKKEETTQSTPRCDASVFLAITCVGGRSTLRPISRRTKKVYHAVNFQVDTHTHTSRQQYRHCGLTLACSEAELTTVAPTVDRGMVGSGSFSFLFSQTHTWSSQLRSCRGIRSLLVGGQDPFPRPVGIHILQQAGGGRGRTNLSP
jgi:hypothetical protein